MRPSDTNSCSTSSDALKSESLYGRIWSQFNEAELSSIPDQPQDISFVAAQRYFTSTAATKIIRLRDLSQHDAEYLRSEGISLSYLTRNLERTINGRFHDARQFQLCIIRDQAIYAVCPFSGRKVQSNHSLLANINVIFYRFNAGRVFYIITAGIGSGFQKCAVYFPELELAVTAGDEWSFDDADLQELKARVVSNSALCHQYLSDQSSQRRKTAVCLGFYHFAHHLWNELSGIQRLHRAGLIHRVGNFLVTREPLGRLEQIFPEIKLTQITRLADTADLFVEILANRYLAVRVGDDFITRDLGERVRRVAFSNSLPQTHAKIAEFRAQHAPLLWIGIRIGNRSWANQVSGLTALIADLHSKFPKLGVIFDGFSLPADRTEKSAGADEFVELVRQESEIVTEVLRGLDRYQGLGLLSIIGNSIFDATVWAAHIDAYMSPYGTLQHKVGWLVNKSGVIHTNKTLLQNPAEYVWSAVEGSIPPCYVNPSYVVDLQDVERGELAYNGISDARDSGAGIQATNKRVLSAPQFNNYKIEWISLRDDILKLLHSPAKSQMLNNRQIISVTKRKLRKTIQSFTSKLNPSGM